MNTYFTVHMHEEGLAALIGPLQAKVLTLMWREERSYTSKHVHRILSQERTIADTTVMTAMSRMAARGWLQWHREGKAYVSSAALSWDEIITAASDRCVVHLCAAFPAAVLDAVQRRAA